MFRFFKYFNKKEWCLFGLLLLINLACVYLDLKLPDYMGDIVALVLGHAAMSEIWSKGLLMLLVAFGSIACLIVGDFIASYISANYTKRMRGCVFDKVQSFSQGTMNKFTTASLITRSTNDITQIGMAMAMSLKVIIYAPLIAIFAILKIVGKSGELSIATGVSVFALVALIVIVMVFAIPRFKKIQKLTDQVNGINRENLNGLRVVRAYNAEDYQKDKFEVANENLKKNNSVVGKLMSALSPIMTIVMNGLNLAIVWLGAYLVNDGALNVPALTEFTMYSMQVVTAFLLVSVIFVMLPRAAVCFKRVYEVLDADEAINDGQSDAKNAETKGVVEFKNVNFRYPDAEEYVLKNMNFSCTRGQTVAFIGSTGSGKSTVINLIPRFYDATDGQVLVDGVDVRDYKLEDLHGKMGYVPQKGILFSGTVRSNVDFGGKNLSDEQIHKALKIAQAEDFVEKMGGLDAHIAQNGSNLSGGQRQRLSIARAIAKNPEICIFDDSFSALDYKTDKVLRAALKKEMKDVTKFIAAQRIGTIKDADLIIVLDSGKTVGMGTHKQLLETCEVYKQIANSQLSEEEIYETSKDEE